MTTPQVWLEIEQLHPATVIVPLPDGGGPAHVLVPLDDDGQKAAEHAGGLEDVRPDDSLDTADSRVEYTDSEYDEAGYVQVEPCDLGLTLINCQGRVVSELSTWERASAGAYTTIAM